MHLSTPFWTALPSPHAGLWGERGYGDGSTPYTWLSSIALLPWLPHFPPQAFPITVSSLTPPHSIFLSRQQSLPWDCSTIPKLQLPAAAHLGGPASLSGVCMAAARTVWVSFHRCEWEQPQISWLTPSLKCFSSDSDSCPDVGIRPLIQFPHTPRAPPVLLTFPLIPSSYWVLCGSAYSFPLVRYSCSWCSACTSVSEGVFLIWKFFLKMWTLAKRIKKKETELIVSRMKERISLQLLHTTGG